PRALAEHHLERVLLEQRDRVELRIQNTCDRVGLRQRLPDQREGRRQRDAVVEGDALQIRQSLPGLDLRQRPPVVARQLAAKLLDEPRFVGVETRARKTWRASSWARSPPRPWSASTFRPSMRSSTSTF